MIDLQELREQLLAEVFDDVAKAANEHAVVALQRVKNADARLRIVQEIDKINRAREEVS